MSPSQFRVLCAARRSFEECVAQASLLRVNKFTSNHSASTALAEERVPMCAGRMNCNVLLRLCRTW